MRTVSIQEVLDNTKNLPFTTRSAWLQVQNECPDLRRVHAHLKQGTRPSKKLTNIKDVKRYLNVASISRDGLLVTKRNQPFTASSEAIIVPRTVLDGLLTALHIKLDHPSRHQLQMVVQRHFFALDMNNAITRVSTSCHTCASLQKFPSSLVSQSSDDSPEVFGISFAADVIKRCHQLILLLRECSTSYTRSYLIPDEKHDSLRDALTRLIVDLHPLNGPRAVIRVDPAPSFVSLHNHDGLKHLNVSLEIGRIKNKNKNPVAEKAVQELEEELLRQEPGGGSVSETGHAIATARLNSRLRHQGVSSRQLWTQRNQFTNDQLPLSDHKYILSQHKHRTDNHPYSEKAKNNRGLVPSNSPLQVGELVYLVSDRDKSRARDRYLVTSTNGIWCYIKKFTGSQLRAISYKVKLSECYAVPSPTPSTNHTDHHDDDREHNSSKQTNPYQEQPRPIPLDLVRPYDTACTKPIPLQDNHDQTLPLQDNQSVTTPYVPKQTPSTPESNNLNSATRPQRHHKPPQYLNNYILR